MPTCAIDFNATQTPNERCTDGLHRLPAAVVDVGVETSGDKAGNAVLQPHVAVQPVVSFLTQGQLSSMAETRISLAELVQVWRRVPRAPAVVQVQDHAFSNVKKQSYITPAAVC